MLKGTFFYSSIFVLFIVGCSTSKVISIDSNVHMVSSSGAGFDTGGVRSNVYSAANKFCAKSGQTVLPVSYSDVKGKLASHPPSADLKFKCVKKSSISPIEDQSNTNKKSVTEKKDIYTELMKLNELKEKGIISESEFQTEKNKILN